MKKLFLFTLGLLSAGLVHATGPFTPYISSTNTYFSNNVVNIGSGTISTFTAISANISSATISVSTLTVQNTGAVQWADGYTQRYSNVANIKDPPYNAHCDGITDDSIAVQNAVNSTTGTLIFPAGSILISTGIVINHPITIIGTGKATKLVTLSTGNFIMMLSTGTQDVKIEGIYFFGNSIGTDPSNPVVAIQVVRSSNTEIASNFFEAINYGVYVQDDSTDTKNSFGTDIHDNHFISCYGPTNGGYATISTRSIQTTVHHNTFGPGPFERHCVYYSVGTRRSIIDHNTMMGAGLSTIAMNAGTTGVTVEEITIDGNTVYGSGTSKANTYGITGTGGIINLKVINNTIFNSNNTALYFQSSNSSIFPSNILISGNLVSGAFGSGVEMYDAVNSKITNNIFSNDGLDGSVNEITVGDVNNVSTQCVVSDNFSSSSMRYLVVFGAGTHHNSAYRNTSYTMNTSFGIYNDLGTNDVPKINDPNLAKYSLFINPNTDIAHSTGTLAFDSTWILYVATGTTQVKQWVKIGSQ